MYVRAGRPAFARPYVGVRGCHIEDLPGVMDGRFGFVLLFNGISTFVGYLMPNPSF